MTQLLLDSPRLTVRVDRSRDHLLGPETARVTLLEYGDFECPYCGMAHAVTKEVVRILGNELRFAYRHFPLTQAHPHAGLAAEAAEAAGAQERFWPMHDLLFQNQHSLRLPDLLVYAEMLDLDLDRFGADLQQHVHAPRVREDFMSGIRSGVNGTPTFFIDGVRYNASWDLESLLQALRPAL
jgi:protein-disulfide isomerase